MALPRSSFDLELSSAVLHVVEAGGGEDAFLLVHGHPFDGTMWSPQVDALAGRGWRVIVPDLRGYGTSQGAVARFEDFAADLLEVMDRLGVDRFALGGLSMGGQIAMEICAAAPHRVRGLLLAATTPLAETADGQAARLAMAERLERDGMGWYADDAISKMLSPTSIERDPALAAYVLAMMRASDQHGAAAAQQARAFRRDHRATLAGLAVPALVVVGDADHYTTRDDAELQRHLLDAELLWLPGAGHLPNLEDLDAVNAALDRLVEAITGAGRG